MTRYNRHNSIDDEDPSLSQTMQFNESSECSSIPVRYQNSRGTTFWRSRTKLEQCLFLLIFILTLLVIVFMIGSLHDCQPTDNELSTIAIHTQNVKCNSESAAELPCLTESCINAASRILQSIDNTINPCDDFYEYACNQWIKDNPIPIGKSLWNTFGKMEQDNQLVIKNALEESNKTFLSEAEMKARIYYQSCIDIDNVLEEKGATPLITFIRKVGGWSITESDFTLIDWNLAKPLRILQNQYNMGGLFSWSIEEDDKNSSRHIIQIDQDGLTLPTRDIYLKASSNKKILSAYVDYMVNVAILLEPSVNQTHARSQMEDIIAFETKIAEITVPAEDRRVEEALYHQINLSTLQNQAGFIDWTAHFADAFKLINRNITSDEMVVVYGLQFLEKLTKIIQTYEETTEGKIILNNYLVWQAVRTLTSCLSKAFRDSYKAVRKALIGSDGVDEPWRYCVTDTNNMMGYPIGAMFVREKFDGTAKPEAEKMINEVRNAFKENLKSLDWMDSHTIKLAEEKADAITDMIGFPDFIKNATLLDEMFEDLKIVKDEYFENNLLLNIYHLKKNLEKLDQPVNKTKWSMTPSTVNAYYTPNKNQIVFPAGILQLPFYDIKNPKSLTFGAMGVVMGHELTHAFDDQGREYDKYGNLNRWWENGSIAEFTSKTQCFINQYEKYKVNGQNVNGKQTLGENIADNGGLKAAFHAYIKTTPNSDSDIHPLPGINMTHRQLFFVSFAQVWCSSITKEASTLQIEKDPHSPPKYRVIGSLSNLKEFSEEFKCEIGTNMNPENKCIVW